MPFRRSLIRNSWTIFPKGWQNTPTTQTPIDSVRSVLVLACLFGMVWAWHLMSVALTAPMDNIEQLVWSHALEWGYHKHPPLPTWLLALPARLSGYSVLTTAVLGAACTLLSALIFWNLVRQIWGRPSAYIALLAGLCITFYNGRLNYYNHNTVLMLCVSLSAHCWWMILTTGRTRWWIGLGAAAGLGMLSKYQYLLVLVPSAVLIWQLKPWRNHRHLQGMGWAVLTGFVLFSPHLMWLLQQDLADSPIRYALKTARPGFLQNGVNISHRLHSGLWLMDLVLNRCLPALLLLLGLKALSEPERSPSPVTTSQISGTRFLLLWGVLPPLFITLIGLLADMDLQMQWGTAYAIWIVPPLMVLLGLHQRWICAPLTWLALGLFALIQSLLLLQSYHTSFYGCCANAAPHRWRLFDSSNLASELDASAREAVGGTFKIIVGPTTVAGAVSLALPDKPRVLIDHNLKISPWIHPQELHFAGVVELWPPKTGPDDRTILPSGWGWSLYAQPVEPL
jgi:4-amino-4-deoxy-L-arabinose transferase-like glycosyltransferase